MSEAKVEPRLEVAASGRAGRAVLLAFGGTLFLSALLLFAVQPFFAKLVLPRLGGTPAVWSVAMVFFQTMLLAGCLYAHVLVRNLRLSLALAIHAVVMASALVWLPLGIAAGFETPPAVGLPLWLLTLFASSVGFPFFAVSASAPLLQAWFARTGHPQANDPYFLYGASNVGGFAALLSYPVLFEPLFPLGDQARLWTGAYLLLVAAVLGCGAIAWNRSAARGAASSAMTRASAPVAWSARFGWVGRAFVPSALLIAVTAHLSTNIAAAPFLWVLPLAIFLLTFVLVFQRQQVIPHRTMQLILPLAAAAALLTVLQPALFGALGGIGVNLFGLFVIAMTWHGELVSRRPAAEHLTEFYLCMSIGGVLGGAFTSLAAPVIFNTVAEFPILLAASFLALPEARNLLKRPLGMTAAAAGFIILFAANLSVGYSFSERSFFGVTMARMTEDGRFRILYHGTTIHGAEKAVDIADPNGPTGRPEPITYFTREGPLGVAMRMQRARTLASLSVGVIGLGTGAMACHAETGDKWRFFEIDPAIIHVATDPHQFNFLSACTPDAPIVLGDARLTIAREPDASLDVLVIDAFSSNAIPVHLLTREAFQTYVSKLKPNGIIEMNITNEFVELASVVGATTQAEGLYAAFFHHTRTPTEIDNLRAYSDVAVVVHKEAELEPFIAAGFTRIPAPGSKTAPWTDDYSNVIAAILRKQGLM